MEIDNERRIAPEPNERKITEWSNLVEVDRQTVQQWRVTDMGDGEVISFSDSDILNRWLDRKGREFYFVEARTIETIRITSNWAEVSA